MLASGNTRRPSIARFAAATLLGGFAMLITGGVLYGVLFVDLFREGAVAMDGVMRARPAIVWIIAGQLGFALLVSLVIVWRGASTAREGLLTGAVVGGLMGIGYDFAQYGTTNLWSLTATLIDPVLSAVLVGAGGAVTAWILWRGTPPPTHGEMQG